MSVSSRIKEAMDRKGFSQADLVKMAEPYCEKYHTRFGTNDINQYLKGKYAPKGVKLNILCEILNASPAFILDLESSYSDEEEALINSYRLASMSDRNAIKLILNL